MYLPLNLNVVNKVSLILISIAMSIVFNSSQAVAYSNAEYSAVQTPQELQLESIRLQEVKAIKEALGLRSPQNRQAELYYRLAELYLESYRADFLVEGRVHDQKVQANPQARFERTRSRTDLQNGIDSARRVLGLNVEFKKLDKVYYFLAYNYGEIGDSAQSVYYYKQLVEKFPGSPFVAEGYRVLADDSFKRGEFDAALGYYEQALKRANDNTLQARILQRIAWCHYRKRNSEQAISSMKKAISLTKADDEKFFSVREEGLRDLAIFYAETGRVDEAIQYFEENAGGTDKLSKSLEKLGKEYERSGQEEKATRVYAALLKLNTQDDSQFRTQAKLIELDLRQGRIQQALLRTEKLPAIPMNSRDPETLQAALNLKSMIRRTATDHHDKYRKDESDMLSLKHAEKAYSLYLTRFLNSDEGKAEKNEIRMYLAEVKRDLKKPKDSADLYRVVVQENDPKYAKEAASSWVAVLVEQLKIQNEASGGKKGSALSDTERQFVEASDVLKKSIPDSVETRESRLRAAQILAGYPASQSEGVARAKSLSEDSPDTSQGVLAARLWLQTSVDQANVSKQNDSLRATVVSIRENSILLATDKKGKGELSKDLDVIDRRISVAEITSLEKNKDFDAAAQAYEKFASNSKSQAEVDKSYGAAISSYTSAGKSAEVLRVAALWRKKGGKPDKVDGLIKNSASDLFIQGRFEESASLFYELGKNSNSLSAVMTAAQIYDGALLKPKAYDVYSVAVGMSKNKEDMAKNYKSLADIALDVKDDKGQLNSWRQCSLMDTSLKAECFAKVGDIYLKLSDWDQARAAYTSATKIKKGPSASSPYIAYSQYRVANILEKGMRKEALSFPTEKLLSSFQNRVKDLKPVSDAYQAAIELGGPWGVAATERVGDFATELAADVEQVIKDPQATAQLKSVLLPVTKSLKEKALQNYKKAFEHAIKDDILSPALPVIHDRLVDSGVAGYFRSQGPKFGIRLIGIGPDGGKLGRDAALVQVRAKLNKDPADALSWIDYGNLLWGQGRPGLAQVAYQRSFDLNKRVADAMNNLAVVMVSDQGNSGYENWYSANEALSWWKKALRNESENPAALYNMAHFHNYYRLFKVARAPLETVSKKIKIAEVQDALAITYAGLGLRGDSEAALRAADGLGSNKNRFVRTFLDASKLTGKACLDRLDALQGEPKAYERSAIERLRTRCAQ